MNKEGENKIMKMIYAFIISFSFVILSGMTAFASDIAANVSYQLETRTLTIQGSLPKSYKSPVNIFIMPADKNRESLRAADINSAQYAAKTIFTDAEDHFVTSIILPLSFESGKYTAYINYGTVGTASVFIHLNMEEANQAVQRINSAEKSEFEGVVEANLDAFAIDSAEVVPYQEQVINILYYRRPAARYTPETFLEQYMIALAVSKLKKGEKSLEEVLDGYNTYLKMDIAKDYDQYNLEIQSELGQLLAAADYTKSPFRTVYMENLFLARIKKAVSYEQLEQVILEMYGIANIDLTAYNSIKNGYYEDNVFRNLFRDGINSFDTIKSKFDGEVQAQIALKNQSSQTGGSTGGGGSKRPGGGNTVLTNIPAYEPPKTEPDVLFADVEGHWAKDSIVRLEQLKVINGFEDGSFGPERKVLRCEFAKFIVTAMNIPTDKDNSFDDVSEKDWYYPYVSAAVKAGLVQGSGSSFNPNGDITREDAAVIIYRALEYKKIALSGEFQFNDEDIIAPYAAESVSRMAGSGVIQGDGGNFNPKGYTTRAEAAMLTYKLLQWIEKQ